jgi:peptide/nickel transport system substrate-binding protein
MPEPHRRLDRRDLLRLGGGALLLAACGGRESMLAREPRPPAQRRQGGLALAPPPGRRDGGVPAALVYACLVALDPRSGRVYGDLADVVELAEPLVVRVRLRGGLRFHANADGVARAITAAEVRREFAERAAAGEFFFAEGLERVEAPDERTLLLRLRAPFSLLFDYLADAASAGVRAVERSAVVEAPLGSGPFMPAAAGARGVTLAPHPAFHRARQPLLQQLTVAPAAAASEPRGGEDPPELRVLGAEEVRPVGAAGAVVARRASRRLLGLGLSLLPQKGGRAVRHVEAFRDARVRRAVAAALDRGPLLELHDGVASGPVGPAHAADALPQAELARHALYRHDPAEARALLAAAGHEGLAFGLEASTRPAGRGLGPAIEAQLRAAGFAPTLRLLPPADAEQLLAAGDFEAALVELDELRTPDLGLRLHMSGGLSGTFSWWGYSDPTFDAAARQAFAEVDPRRRAERARAAQRVLLQQVPALLPISAQHQYALLPPALRGYDFEAFEFNDGWLASRWYLEAGRDPRA